MKDPVFSAAKKIVRRLDKQIGRFENIEGENLHALRVATKKLRALAQLYRPSVKATEVKSLAGRIKILADRYSGSRDADVMGVIVPELLKGEQSIDECAGGWLLEQIASFDHDNQAPVDLINPIEELESILQYWQDHFKAVGPDALKAGVDYSLEKARKQALRARQTGSEKAFHRCRKWLKCYLYQRQLTDTGGTVKVPQKRLKRLEKQLGALHDYCVLAQHLSVLSTMDQPGIDPGLKAAGDLLMQRLQAHILRGKQASCREFEKVFTR